MVRLGSVKTGVAISALALLAFSGSAIPTAAPAAARVDISIGLNFGGVGFGYFHGNLSRRGHWINHPLWGDVWMPPRGFRPYSNGYWTYSDYGLLWIGYDRWSDITEHYGRWVWDRYYGTWLWIPGYVWSPGWVIWRSGGGYFGWLPMPPDYGDYDDGPYFGGRYGWDDDYGYADWYDLSRDSFFGLWIFVDDDHFYSRDYRNYAFSDSRRVRSVINHAPDTTNYAIQGDRIVNRSISAARLERITHRRIEPVDARKFLKGNVPIATVAGGRALARKEGSGESGPHVHDRNFQPLAGRGGRGEKGAMPLLQPEPDRGNMRERMRTRGGAAAPNMGPQPNAGEARARERSRGNDARPNTGLQPNAGEDRARGRDRDGDNGAMPSPQPQPNPNEDRGARRGGNRGDESQMSPSPQPQPDANEDRGGRRGSNRGGENQMSPSPQPQPNAEEGSGRPRGNAGRGAERGDRGEHPNAAEKQGADEQPANPDDEQPANPDEEKRKKRKRDATSPQD